MCLSIALLATGVLWESSFAQGQEPAEHEAKLCQLVLAKLEATHLAAVPFDDALAHRLLERFLAALDPERIYFLQSDIAEFETERDTLDDLLLQGRLEFATRVHDRLLERMEARGEALLGSIHANHDFEAEDFYRPVRKLADYPTAENVADVCRRHAKFQLLARMATGESLSEARHAVAKRVAARERRFRDLDRERLTATYLASAASAYDPHTKYLSPTALKELKIALTRQLVGIGVYLRSEEGLTVVTKLVPGGAAEKDGRLRPGDRIVALSQGEETKLADVRGTSLQSIVEQIRGPAGTVVRMRVEREDDSSEIIAIHRAPVELRDHVASGRIVEVESSKRPPLSIGVIDLPGFYGSSGLVSRGNAPGRSSTSDLERILAGFSEQGVAAVVLDLRRNAGGLLDEAISVTGLFVDAGPVVQVRDRTDEIRLLEDKRSGAAWEGPLIVLTSRQTASAAEIVAGAIQDYRRGLIVGAAATYGKGTVQSLVPILDGTTGANDDELGALKVTVSQFYRPLGDSTQQRGVAADLELPSPDAAARGGESSLTDALAFDRIRSAKIERYDFVQPGMIGDLTLLSATRRESDVDFERIRDELALAAKLRERKWVRLDLGAVRTSLFGESGRADAGHQSAAANDPTLREALEITRDYVETLASF